MSRPQTVVERVEHLLHDSAPDEIAVLLNISEAEVRRIAQLLDERGPADHVPTGEEAQALVEAVEALPEPVDDPTPTREQVKAAAVVIGRATSGSDLGDLAGMLGIGHAVEAAERWIDARDRADYTGLAAEMAEAFTAIDAAVDAITPEQVEARLADILGKKPAETWGVDATQAPMSAPGDATTPTKPDTLAPARPMTQRLADHVVSYTDLDALADVLVEASEPEQIHKPEPASIVAEANANDWPPPGHVHDPFPVADETGTFHAQCECGTRWDKASCDMCGLPVTALVIAQTGLRRHKHHRTEATP